MHTEGGHTCGAHGHREGVFFFGKLGIPGAWTLCSKLVAPVWHPGPPGAQAGRTGCCPCGPCWTDALERAASVPSSVWPASPGAGKGQDTHKAPAPGPRPPARSLQGAPHPGTAPSSKEDQCHPGGSRWPTSPALREAEHPPLPDATSARGKKKKVQERNFHPVERRALISWPICAKAMRLGPPAPEAAPPREAGPSWSAKGAIRRELVRVHVRWGAGGPPRTAWSQSAHHGSPGARPWGPEGPSVPAHPY